MSEEKLPPRVPPGTPEGGQFTSDGGGHGVKNKLTEAIRKYSSDPGRDLEYSHMPSAKRISDTIPKAAWGHHEEDDDNDDEVPKFGSQEELDALLGEEFTGYLGQAAVDKLLREKRGHIKGAFHRDGIGDIDLLWGDGKIGLSHIIDRRSTEKKKGYDGEHIKRVLEHIEETINKGVFKSQNQRGDITFVYNGYGVSIAPTYHGNKITYLLTAFKNDRSAKK